MRIREPKNEAARFNKHASAEAERGEENKEVEGSG